MDRAPFRDWFSRIDELTAAQCRKVAAVLSDPPEGEASLAAIELGVGEERRCPHCGSGGAVSRGKSREQVPILVAADRGGATLSRTLPKLDADSVKRALAPVIAWSRT